MDGDYVEGWGRDVEVCEPGVLQVVKVALGQSVPRVGQHRIKYKATKSLQDETYCKLRDKLYIMKLIFAQETDCQGKYLTSNPKELLWILPLAPQNNSF